LVRELDEQQDVRRLGNLAVVKVRARAEQHQIRLWLGIVAQLMAGFYHGVRCAAL
jgi:hypothetical protein